MTAAHAVTDLTRARDARQITITPAPRRDPPFDDELTDRPKLVLLDGRTQPRLPFADVAAPGERRIGSTGRASVRLGVPAAGRFGHTLIQGIIEVVNGLRPAAQLRGHLSPAIQLALTRRAGTLGRFRTGGRPPTVRSVHVSEPIPGAAEISAVVDIGGRVRAIAARIELSHGRWRCVQLQFG